MDPSSLASALVGARGAQVQLALAGKMLKMNVDHNAAIADMVAAAVQSSGPAADGAAGSGHRVDITA